MPAAELERQVDEGIEAVKRGERARARVLLLRVVEQDERNKRAWLWLSFAVDDPADKLVALENVATLDAMNAEAAADAAQVQAGAPPSPIPVAGARPSAPPPPAPSTPSMARATVASAGPGEARAPSSEPSKSRAPESTLDEDEGLDDPCQCVYCGAPAGRVEVRCPRCNRDLVVRKQKPSQSLSRLRFAATLLAVDAVLSWVQALGPAFMLSGYGPSVEAAVSALGAQRYMAIVESYLGSLTTPSPPSAYTLLVLAVARGVILLVCALGVSGRVTSLYYATVGAMVADLVWAGVAFNSGLGGWLAMAGNAGFALAILSLSFASDRDFHAYPERLLTVPDRNAHGALDFFRRGLHYRKRGMWALAVAQWRRAVALMPTEPQFYTDLGIAYAQIGRFERSLLVLAEAARQSSNDPQVQEIISLVKAQQAAAVRSGGRPK